MPEFLRLSSSRGTSRHDLSCFNSGPTLRAPREDSALPGQEWCSCTCTHRQLQLGCCPLCLWGHRALDKLLSNLAVKHHTTQTGKGTTWRPPSCCRAARAGLNEHTHGRQESKSLFLKKIQIRTFSFPNDSTAASRTPTDLLGVYLHAVLAYCLWA